LSKIRLSSSLFFWSINLVLFDSFYFFPHCDYLSWQSIDQPEIISNPSRYLQDEDSLLCMTWKTSVTSFCLNIFLPIRNHSLMTSFSWQVYISYSIIWCCDINLLTVLTFETSSMHPAAMKLGNLQEDPQNSKLPPKLTLSLKTTMRKSHANSRKANKSRIHPNETCFSCCTQNLFARKFPRNYFVSHKNSPVES
jgi:hypothetical protein